jgi:hypothetical protein
VKVIRTAPRLLVAEFVRSGDEIAMHPMPSRHTPDEACDCPSTAPAGMRHCSQRYIPVRGLSFVENDPASVLWLKVISEPTLALPDELWFGMRRLLINVMVPRTDMLGEHIPHHKIERFVADLRDPMVIRERLRIAEGQPDVPVGVTAWAQDGDAREVQPPVHEPVETGQAPIGGQVIPLPKRKPGSNMDATQKLSISKVPVGVQMVALGGVSELAPTTSAVVHPAYWAHQHEEFTDAAALMTSRDSDL